MSLEQLLDSILDSGWNPTRDIRVSEGLKLLANYPKLEAIETLSKLSEKYREDLEQQTKNLSGSGNQQDLIDAYLLAYESSKELLSKL